MSKKIDYQSVVDEVINTLLENNEWEDRFATYAKDILKNGDKYTQKRKRFRVLAPLFAYTSVSKIKGTDTYDLRFLGQSIATVSVNRNNMVYISTTGKDKSNREYFECALELPDNTPWNDTKARDFRKYFHHIPDSTKKAKSKEHTYENMLLSHFKQSKSTNKKLLNIQPVLLSEQFFQMPTAVSASKKGQAEHSRSGGGIDILARVRKGAKSTLAVIELKDENRSTEGPEIAIQQAIAYATFITRLLRSKSGDQWWKIFGFGGAKIPDKLTIYAAVAMPDIKERPNFVEVELGLPVVDRIILHYMTFSERDYKLLGIMTSISECKCK